MTEELGSEVNLIFHLKAPQVHHDIMIAKFDKAAKDEVEAEELAGEGQSLSSTRTPATPSATPTPPGNGSRSGAIRPV